MRAISLSTLDKYKRNALHDANITNDVLKVKLNCLIDATAYKHRTKRGNATIYQFGSCLLHVTGNIITDIRWTGEKESPALYEVKKMKELFLLNGLNKKGNKFVEQEKIFFEPKLTGRFTLESVDMDKNLMHREVKIGDKEGEITNILGVGYEVSFYNVNENKTFVDAKDIEKYLV